MRIRHTASVASIVLGVLMVLAAAATWFTVSATLADQQITVSDDAAMFAGEPVDGPLTAYAEAQVIEVHALEATDGLTYAEMERDDPLRDVAMNASFLRASLFTSVVAFGVAAMAAAGGLLFVLVGLGIRDVEERTEALRAGAPAAVGAPLTT